MPSRLFIFPISNSPFLSYFYLYLILNLASCISLEITWFSILIPHCNSFSQPLISATILYFTGYIHSTHNFLIGFIVTIIIVVLVLMLWLFNLNLSIFIHALKSILSLWKNSYTISAILFAIIWVITNNPYFISLIFFSQPVETL